MVNDLGLRRDREASAKPLKIERSVELLLRFGPLGDAAKICGSESLKSKIVVFMRVASVFRPREFGALIFPRGEANVERPSTHDRGTSRGLLPAAA
jgi:hypothetical protein